MSAYPDTATHVNDVTDSGHGRLDFELPTELEASEPPEARGLRRDDVRLMVSYRRSGRLVHTHFHELATFLNPGDLLVINTSGTLNAALQAVRSDGSPLELHLSTHLPNGRWTLELRVVEGKSSKTFYGAEAGEVLQLPDGGTATLLTPYAHPAGQGARPPARLWLSALSLPGAIQDYLAVHGFPIRYGYVSRAWPASYYQSVYATEAGSAEMPSAGRAFTSELITQLVARGIVIAPLLLHTGVASLEKHEAPYAEWYRVPSATAALVNDTRQRGGRIIAVGTTVVRALETVTEEQGHTHPGEGWTDLVVTPERGLRAVTAMLTGWHEPQASHLAMLEALAGRKHLRRTYAEALREGYLWHEFGDLHLILP